jgi:hypothetical protein
MTEKNSQLAEERKRKALYISLTTMLVQIAVTALLATTAELSGTPIMIMGGNIFAALISVWLNRRGKAVLGIKILLAVQNLTVLLMGFQIGGSGLPMAAFVVTLTFAISSSVLSKDEANNINIASGVVALLIVLLDVFDPFERPQNANVSASWGMSLILVSFFLFIILRRFKTYTLRSKIIIFFLTAASLGIVTITVVLVSRNNATLQDNAFAKLSAVQTIKHNQLVTYLDERESTITTLGTTINVLLCLLLFLKYLQKR